MNPKIEIHNGIALLKGDSHFGPWIKQAGRLDHDQWLLSRVLPHVPVGGTVIDAGAYIGDQSIAYAKKVGQDGRVFCFEPNRDAYECIEHNSKPYKWWSCYNFGLSDKEENVGIGFHGSNFGMAHLVPGDGVQCMAIDSWDLQRLDFFKLDVEGYELKALKGAQETIRKHRPVMLIEMNKATLSPNFTNYQMIFEFLDSQGYTYQNIDGTDNLTADQYDLLCLPQKK